jgi:putative DNA primase/helicase
MLPEHKAALDNLATLNRQRQPGDKQPRKLLTVRVGELLAMKIPTREMHLDPVLPEKGIVEIYSKRGVGKTHTSLGMAYAVASGGKFLSWSAPKPRRVLFIDGEMPLVTLQERLASIVAGAKEEPPTAEYLVLLASDYQREGMPDLATAEGQAEIEPLLAGVELVVLDNLSTLCRTGRDRPRK